MSSKKFTSANFLLPDRFRALIKAAGGVHKLAELLGVSAGYVSELGQDRAIEERRIKGTGGKIWFRLRERLHPAWFTYLSDPHPFAPPLNLPVDRTTSLPYAQPPEEIGIPRIGREGNGRDPGSMSYTAPDLAGYRVTRLVDPENERYLQMAVDVLEGPEKGIREALKSNIVSFHEALDDKRRVRRLEKEINQLKKDLTGHCPDNAEDVA